MNKNKNAFKHKDLEAHWQKEWTEEGVNAPNIKKSKNPYYNLWMFPYPSAEGLHAGHAFASTGSDVYGRFMKMREKDVFQPIGYDSFGIHSENFAISLGEHPEKMIKRTTKHYAEQLKSLGHAYDWTKTVTTSDINYYQWTQWLFIELFKAGLAYRNKAEVNWCPSCKTVLADEQVIHEECERCGHKVVIKDLEQWFFRITDYADRLLSNLEKIDWPEKIKITQRNWIGKSQGATITFELEVPGQKNGKHSVEVFTTRPDTLYGATFLAVSPRLGKKWLDTGWKVSDNVSKYINTKLKYSKKQNTEKDKTGVLTKVKAINPVNGEKIPVFVADYVLMEYGTGAIMGVPGHDERDFEFANKNKLDVICVIKPSGGRYKIVNKSTLKWWDGNRYVSAAYTGDGTVINSGSWNGLKAPDDIKKVIKDVKKRGWGKPKTSYHLRDWLISRQRYWGPPIPMIYCEHCAKEGKSYFTMPDVQGESLTIKLREKQADWDHVGWWPAENLPVELPYMRNYQPKGTSRGPLAGNKKFYEVKCPACGNKAKRETDVSDTFLDSSWYFLRYPSVGLNSNNESLPWDREVTRKWLPVDLYFGGAEHAVLHLMYARFVTQVLYDLSYLKFDEPFPRFYAHGLMIKDGAKMSKSKGNVINPDVYVKKYGADTLRLYLMFMGPMDGYPDFRDTGIEGMRRFVEKVWSLYENYKDVILTKEEDCKDLSIKMHQTIKKVSNDLENFHYNTAISAIMEFVNLLRDKSQRSKVKGQKSKIRCSEWDDALKVLAQLLAPFTPHLAEEAWTNMLGEKFSIHTSIWPKFVPELVREETVTIAVQVNGKLRATINLESSISNLESKVVEAAKADQNVKKWLEGKKIKTIIFIEAKLLNFVIE